MKKFLVFCMLFFVANLFAQQPLLHYKTNAHQIFRLRPGTEKTFHYVKMDKADMVQNTLFMVNDTTKKLMIPQDGFYEISAMFHFNPNTSNIKYNRGGINFGIVQVSEGNEQYIAATRKSFDKENQSEYSTIIVQPTIVYLQKDVVVAPAISAGLLANVLLAAEIGCEKKNKNCTSFEWTIKRISNEKAFQKYF